MTSKHTPAGLDSAINSNLSSKDLELEADNFLDNQFKARTGSYD